jgi:hypothetical protein
MAVIAIVYRAAPALFAWIFVLAFWGSVTWALVYSGKLLYG